MTPLAYMNVRDATISRRKDILQVMSGVHCFEVTDVIELALELSGAFTPDSGKLKHTLELVFLPAPKTWIEFTRGGVRSAFHCETAEGGGSFAVTLVDCMDDSSSFVKAWHVNEETGASFAPKEGSEFLLSKIGDDLKDQRQVIMRSRLLLGLLAIINSPNIVERDDHVPRRTLEKKARSLSKEFEVRPWHEIRLRVNPSDHSEGGDGPITGQRALHFCRKFVRVRLGKLEYVRAHWRGNPDSGIAPATYKVGDPR